MNPISAGMTTEKMLPENLGGHPENAQKTFC
jgi:hypothetical protein